MKLAFASTLILTITSVLSCRSVAPGINAQEQIERSVDGASRHSEYTCRPSDGGRQNEYIWISKESQDQGVMLQVSSYEPIGKAGYKNKSLISLKKLVRVVGEDFIDYNTGTDTTGTNDTQYDFSKTTTLVKINTKNLTGRLNVKGYAANLDVTCSKN
jgi:hypothetical protein